MGNRLFRAPIPKNLFVLIMIRLQIRKWYNFRLDGEEVVSEITFVPTLESEELTCEAYNERVNLRVKQTVQVIR